MASAYPIQESSRAASYLKLTNQSHFHKAVMFVGAIGAGKSTLCNFLVKREQFETAVSPVAVTREAKCDIFPFEGQHYMIVDCPGFLETREENEKRVLSELCRAGVMAREGVDAIAFVINPVDRFPEDTHEQGIQILNKLGANFWNHMFIIFTHEDEMKTRPRSNEDYIEAVLNAPKCPLLLLQIYQQVNCRHMNIESRKPASDTKYWEEKCGELVGHINFISEMNENTRYHSVLMSKGKEFYFKCLDLQAENQKLLEEISELKSQMDKKGERCDKVKEQLEALNNRVPEMNKILNKEVADYEKNMFETIFSQKATVSVGVVALSVAAIVGITIMKFWK